ncbi:hypothetical protein [Streptomyces showdoensis]|uniref:LigA protein n=2 Tax=Streptomyces showdoensis TaxID=68268 RepID=A0A2P2GLZ7_STREW|nr:hypothetical protein [Streptomyces showdoensis]KKZ72538.1 hypothetical protein VO63_17470 [Streptomyces showdoensis]
MSRTTPPRTVDVAVVFPQLAPLARTATRLHPRPGSPAPHESSVGGPFLWPADEPWPYCQEVHEWHDGRVDDWPAGWHEGPNAMLPLLQLYVRDVPLLRPPGQADLLQVLWCPCEHPPEHKPPTALFWRSSTDVTDILATPPKTFAVEYDEYVPEPCVLAPEQVAEYPNLLELTDELRHQLGDWSRWQAAGSGVDSSYAPYPEAFYTSELSVAPGWKVGGWPPWGLTDPVARFCTVCDSRMAPLLTISSNEWDSSNHGWIPYEDRALAEIPKAGVTNSPRVQVSQGNHLQLYVCPTSPDHPHTDLIQ